MAVDRRAARAMRRRRDRYLSRRAALLRVLTDYGLMPADEDARRQLVMETNDGKSKDGGPKAPGKPGDISTSVHGLRARALTERLMPHQIGRLLFSLNQRRGFKSNRKTDRRDNDQARSRPASTDSPTRCGWLAPRPSASSCMAGGWKANPSAPGCVRKTGENAKGDGYDFYPSRAELEHEFDLVCEAQAVHHPELLDDERVAHLRSIIFYQRPLKPVIAGRCSYNQHEARLPKAHPLFQTFRLYKEVNELALVGEDQQARKLSVDQRDALIRKLRSAKTATFLSLRRTLKLGSEFRFNKESETRTGLLGDEIHVSMSDPKCFGSRWLQFSVDRQWEILSRLREEEDSLELHKWLTEGCGLSDDQAKAAARVQLPDGFGRLGATALEVLTDALERETCDDGTVITEAEAARRCGYNHSDKSDPNFPGHDLLPNYQEVLEWHIPPGTGNPDDVYDVFRGRITNPSVHIAMNQLRRVVNALIRRYGKPDRIAIELGRELKLSDKQKGEIDRTIRKNTQDAAKRSAKIEELRASEPRLSMLSDNGYNRLRLKLWEELNKDQAENRVCIYCGKPIATRLIFDQTQVDIDHILPYSKTLDDGEGNKILCHTHCNRQKRNRAPVDVGEWSGRYDDILARAGMLPKNKRWRFARDAMEKFADEEGFLARQLTDMQYGARMALTYLASLYPTEEADAEGVLRRHSRVRALPGRMTEMLRRRWGLNELLPDHDIAGSDTVKEKNRKDHRHHAIDACVIACTSRSLIQKIATASAALEREGAERVVAALSDPWPGFREELRAKVNAAVVSHRPDHGTVSRAGYDMGKGQTAGKLHNDTAYGLTGERDDRGNDLVVSRRPLSAFRAAKDFVGIRDRQLREALQEATYGLAGRDFEQAVHKMARQERLGGKDNPFRNLRRIRVVEPLKTIPIRDKTGKAYKGYKGDSNHRYDVWRLPDGKWVAEVVTTFDAHQSSWQSAIRQRYPTAKKILSLNQDDAVAADGDDGRIIYRVVKFNASGQIYFAPHNEAGALKARDTDPNDPFKYVSKAASGLRAINARQVRIDEIGQVFDPGPRS
ncbi:type II CRISPR RNA-guided endonuclease Cas9 [Pseudaminobacter salicylatoxidans]|uniref:type II CRISPR RNA-guided endonuclease Cas9 n=1 Tax=Pseudaminobacter salicylatoxidans TaxID=93369 RepID=UPI0002F8A794|nr:type II CRISPR RNA-guided endonuclease Cas9 [Pseudaminobacter salicylatoxidans]